ncbi:MAG TPA: ScyD/ScyE family protein [Marmoricola sp.]|nr:ScyD/ScyE family protein [Marmoricola sp.]
MTSTRPRSPRSRRVIGAAVGALTLVTVAAGSFATAPLAAGAGGQAAGGGGQVVARGLNSPRLLSFTRSGVLYVAEAGKGGSGPCVMGGEGEPVCLGMTGAITQIRHGHARRVVRHLPSIAGQGGAQALGPANVRAHGGSLVISMGAGIDAKARRSLGAKARHLGTLLRTTVAHPHRQRVIADIVRFEFRHNPDHSPMRDSDPTGFMGTRRGFVLTDSGGNDLLRVHRNGRIHVMAVFPDRMVMGPSGQMPMQAVPTAVDRARHAYFVSQLTGYPFPPGAANIYLVRPGHQPRIWASGLTNVTDLAWHRGRLYAVQIADQGLLSGPTGSLIRVHRGDNSSPDVVAGNLMAPYGVALRGHSAYVTTCTLCGTGGQVLRFPIG